MWKYAVTGGAGHGKTATILCLEFRLGQYIVREAARDYIELRQAEGVQEPWLEDDFQLKIVEGKQRRKLFIPKGIERFYEDRGEPDGEAFIGPGCERYLPEIYQTLRDSINIVYDAIFIVDPSPKKRDISEKYRRENWDQSLIQARRLEKVYRDRGYIPEETLLHVPFDTPLNRARFILNKSLELELQKPLKLAL